MYDIYQYYYIFNRKLILQMNYLNPSWLNNIPKLRSGCSKTCNDGVSGETTRTTNYFNKITIYLVHF